ncbi:MAG: hypothetical protein PVI99_02035, partial [Anaerolineales bacterium]
FQTAVGISCFVLHLFFDPVVAINPALSPICLFSSASRFVHPTYYEKSCLRYIEMQDWRGKPQR